MNSCSRWLNLEEMVGIIASSFATLKDPGTERYRPSYLFIAFCLELEHLLQGPSQFPKSKEAKEISQKVSFIAHFCSSKHILKVMFN